jgi:septum site-determining protein MinD
LLDEAVRAVEREYSDVVVDCPAGMRADAGVPLAVADTCLLVATPEPFALADAVRTRELARQLDCGLISVVLNRADSSTPVDVFERILGAPAIRLPTDPALARSIESGRPVVDGEQGIAGTFERLAATVRAAERV